MPVLAIRSESSPAEWTERTLLRRVLNRDERAWRELIRRYRALMYRCVTKVTVKFAPTMTSADVDEIYAEILLGLLRNDMSKLRQYDPERGTKLSSWIGLISINAAYDFLRGMGRGPVLDSMDGVLEPEHDSVRTPLDELIEKERWEHLNGLLSEFSEKDRVFVDLYFGRGMEAADVAETMDISLKTVYSKKHKIRAHLRKCLERQRTDSAIADLLELAA